jgi:hypothetical protein
MPKFNTMKKLITILSLFFAAITFAQSPQRMNFQSVVRDANNELIQNGEIGIRVSILESSSTGTPVFVERHQPTTNENGLFTLEIGAGSLISGSFNAINWKNNQYWLKTEYDLTGGTSYTLSSTVQFLSVPYSFNSDYAQNSGNQIENIIDNGNGTLTFEYLNGSSFTTAPLTGLQGQQGESAYQIWINQGNSGTEQDFIESLKGTDGQNGTNGTNGESAYQVWLSLGNTGTEQDFIESLKGTDGFHVTNSFIQNDSLYIQLSSGQTLNAGFLAGVSIVNTVIQNDSLLVYFSNGQVINAGYLNFPGQNTNDIIISIPIVSNIQSTSAVLSATLIERGNELVTHFGICISINPNPTVKDYKGFSFGNLSENQNFSMSVNQFNDFELSPSTTYYVRSFATNCRGTVYSNQNSFTTLP